MEGDNLTPKDKFEIFCQASLQLIPYGLGGVLSSLYFGIKQEKRFKRIEDFYSEIAVELKELKKEVFESIENKIYSLKEIDRDYLIFLIENINDKIEREPNREKIKLFKKFFMNILKNPPKSDNYEIKRFFLEALDTMSINECELLAFLSSQENSIKVDDIIINKNNDRYLFLSSINRLKGYGFVKTFQMFYATDEEGAETSFEGKIQISSLGKNFCEFCIVQ